MEKSALRKAPKLIAAGAIGVLLCTKLIKLLLLRYLWRTTSVSSVYKKTFLRIVILWGKRVEAEHIVHSRRKESTLNFWLWRGHGFEKYNVKALFLSIDFSLLPSSGGPQRLSCMSCLCCAAMYFTYFSSILFFFACSLRYSFTCV